MSSSSRPSSVKHSYTSDSYLPQAGEIIILRLSDNLVGPGSAFTSLRASDLPSRATPRNFHHAVVLNVVVNVRLATLTFTVLPVPSYSGRDLLSQLSSTEWLLNQPKDFQLRHIPLPYEEPDFSLRPRPLFQTPVAFGDPLHIRGWKDRRPSWVLTVPQEVKMKMTTLFRAFAPRVLISEDELTRLEEYVKLVAPSLGPDVTARYPTPPGDGDASSGGADATFTGDSAPPRHDPNQNQEQPGNSDGSSEGNAPSNGSSALQELYSTDAVREAFAHLSQYSTSSTSLDIDTDDDGDDFDDDDFDDDDDDEWEDNMDPVTFARYYAPQNPYYAKIVEDHDRAVQERLDRDIKNWAAQIVAFGEWKT